MMARLVIVTCLNAMSRLAQISLFLRPFVSFILEMWSSINSSSFVCSAVQQEAGFGVKLLHFNKSVTHESFFMSEVKTNNSFFFLS